MIFLHIAYVVLLGLPAMFWHECFHAITALLLGVPVKRIGISRRGMFTHREQGTDWQNLAITVAGPIGNFVLAGALWVASPVFAWVNLACGIYNLLPFRNSDGSRILQLSRTR